MARPSQLFVVQGDLNAVHADISVVPSDARLRVGERWAPLVPDAAARAAQPGGIVRVITSTSTSRHTLVANVANTRDVSKGTEDQYQSSITHLQEGVRVALRAASTIVGPLEHRQTVRPLLSLPLVGTGAGGFAERRGGAIKALLQVLDDHLPALGFDVVLVCMSRSDYEAVQSQRHPRAEFWSVDADAQLQGLVDHARQGSMAVLFGAGVSMSLGQPTWSELLKQISSRSQAGTRLGDLSSLDPVDAAALLSESLPPPDGLQQALTDLLARKGCTLTHALLASLRPTVAITTNYDTGYEQALEFILDGGKVPSGNDPVATSASAVRVLPWQGVDEQTAPRVVKLHGDLARGSIVLSRDQFVEMHAFRRPLTALLQERLLAGRVLAVGTSFSDSTLSQAVFEVQSLRRSVSRHDEASPTLGTLVQTDEDPARRALLAGAFDCLDAAHLLHEVDEDTPEVAERARRVDLFLDELALRSRSRLGYLADPHYADLVDDDQAPLADIAKSIIELHAEIVAGIPRLSPGRVADLRVLEDALRSFGAGTEPAEST